MVRAADINRAGIEEHGAESGKQDCDSAGVGLWQWRREQGIIGWDRVPESKVLGFA
jgi:hypothetical protein